jgi:hypothetical protein
VFSQRMSAGEQLHEATTTLGLIKTCEKARKRYRGWSKKTSFYGIKRHPMQYNYHGTPQLRSLAINPLPLVLFFPFRSSSSSSPTTRKNTSSSVVGDTE